MIVQCTFEVDVPALPSQHCPAGEGVQQLGAGVQGLQIYYKFDSPETLGLVDVSLKNGFQF